MIRGEFVDTNKPMVPAIVSWDQSVQNSYFILDTGFTGDLQVTPEMALELGLNIDGVTEAKMATNQIVSVPTATALATMEGRTVYVTALISKGLPLLGISFLEKFSYKAVVDCKFKIVILEISN